MFWLHFVSNNISLYRDTSEAIYRYVCILYRCNSNLHLNFLKFPEGACPQIPLDSDVAHFAAPTWVEPWMYFIHFASYLQST